MATLYEIETKKLELYEAASSDDEATRQNAKDQLLALAEVREEKLAGCCAYLKNIRAEYDAVDAEIRRLADKRSQLERMDERFEAYLSMCLEKGEKWSNGVHSIGWRKSESVTIADEKVIPAAYMREILKYEPDKKQIKDDLKAGATIPGCELTVKQNLQVK